MANICTRSITEKEFQDLILLLYEGYVDKDNRVIRKNKRTAVALIVQANTGLRIGDVVRLRLSDFLNENGRYRLCIKEQKTGKKRHFTQTAQVYAFIQDYMINMGLSKDTLLFNMTVRASQRNHLGLIDVSTHSFSSSLHVLITKNTKDIRLIQNLLQHASINTIVRYLAVTQQQIDDTLDAHVMLPV